MFIVSNTLKTDIYIKYFLFYLFAYHDLEWINLDINQTQLVLDVLFITSYSNIEEYFWFVSLNGFLIYISVLISKAIYAKKGSTL